MIKHINHQNLLTTPFVAVKQWELFNIQNDDVVLIEPPDSSPEYPVALEYLDYNSGTPIINRDCDIALEQQESDILNYQEGITGSGIFYPDTEEKNTDGTYKRMVHTQTKLSFYNQYRDPTKMFGMEFIDFPLGKTNRELSDVFRLFSIPRHFFGDRLVEGSVRFYDTSLDDTVEITDDGYQNLLAGTNLFSKIQEVRHFENDILQGIANCICFSAPITSVSDNSSVNIGLIGGIIDDVLKVASASDSASFGVGLFIGTLLDAPIGDPTITNIGFLSGSIATPVLVMSGSDSGSVNIGFLNGSIIDTFLTISGSDSGSVNIGFLNGSIIDTVIIAPLQYNSSSVNLGFINGALVPPFY